MVDKEKLRTHLRRRVGEVQDMIFRRLGENARFDGVGEYRAVNLELLDLLVRLHNGEFDVRQGEATAGDAQADAGSP